MEPIQEDLQYIIEKLEADIIKEKATFGIFQYGGGPDESFIKADKEGLKLFALELLKAVKEFDDPENNQEGNLTFGSFDGDWINEGSDTRIDYIEPLAGREASKKQEYKETIGDKLIPYGCGIVALLVIVCFLMGLEELIRWIF
jgi:hypothetical protein